MIISKVAESKVTSSDLEEYKKETEHIKKKWFTALDVNLNKRIISLNFDEDETLTLVNPKIVDKAKQPIVYFEMDSNKNKIRKTVRYPSVTIESDNMETIQLSADTLKWKDRNDLLNDVGLFLCVMAQRLINSIDGIDITHKSVAYNTQIISKKKYGRNDRVMVKSPDGEVSFMKYKKAEPLLNYNYELV